MKNVLIVFNMQPYDGTDVSWNALRLCEQLLARDMDVKVFLMNDSVDLARDAAKAPDGYYDLGQMLKDLIDKGVPVKVCGTCKVRCGIHKGQPYFNGAQEAKMTELAEWIEQADTVLTF